MFPLLTGFHFFNLYTRKNSHNLPTNMVGVLCTSFYFILAIILIMLDTSHHPDALCKICQFKSHLKMVLLELDVEQELGETVLKYVKTREAFATIPIVVVAKGQQAKDLATELGTDEVVLKNSPDEMFKEAIDRCLQRG